MSTVDLDKKNAADVTTTTIIIIIIVVGIITNGTDGLVETVGIVGIATTISH